MGPGLVWDAGLVFVCGGFRVCFRVCLRFVGFWIRDPKWILKDNVSVPKALSPDKTQILTGDRAYLIYLKLSYVIYIYIYIIIF